MYVVEMGIICVERDERHGGMSVHFRNACASLLAGI